MNVQRYAHLLVIGYGNSLRGDDGVGPRLAEALGLLRLPFVRTVICQQLSPEHSGVVSQAHTVVFADASVDEPRTVQFRPLLPGGHAQLMAHAADPRTILAFARAVFDHTPAAWWLTIPATRLEFGEVFSPETEAGYQEAYRRLRAFAEQFAERSCHASGRKERAFANRG